MDFGHALSSLSFELKTRGIQHAVIGGVALAMWGVPRTTLDLDLVADGDRQQDVLAVLDALGYRLLHHSSGYSNHRHPDPGMGQVDIVYVRNGTREQLFAAVTLRLGPRGQTAPVASPEHLAAMKVRAIGGRPHTSEGRRANPVTVSKPTDFNLERDMPLTAADIEAMRRARFRIVDPTTLEWDWISLGVQFPNLSRDRKTHEGVPDFELPPLP